MGKNGRGHIEVQSRNIPWDRGKRSPVKRLDVPANTGTRQLTDARPLRLHSTRSVYLRIQIKYPIPNESFTDTFEWNDTNDEMWSCNICAGMRIFSCVSYVTVTKHIEGINWLCPGIVDLSNQTICSEWTGINFANKSPRLRAVASCAAYLSSYEVGLFMTQQKTYNSNQDWGLVIFIYDVCKYHIIQYVGLYTINYSQLQNIYVITFHSFCVPGLKNCRTVPRHATFCLYRIIDWFQERIQIRIARSNTFHYRNLYSTKLTTIFMLLK
jgi:hypothetical protein